MIQILSFSLSSHSERFCEKIRERYGVMQMAVSDAELFHVITDFPEIVTEMEKFVTLKLQVLLPLYLAKGDSLCQIQRGRFRLVEIVKPISRDSLTEHWFPCKTRPGERAVWIYKENGKPQRNPVKREGIYCINAFKNMTRIFSSGKMLHTISQGKMLHTISREKMFQENSEKTILFTAQEPLIATIRGDMQILLRKNRPSFLNHVLTECAVNAHSYSVKSNEKTELQYKKFMEMVKPNFRDRVTEHWFPRETRLGENSFNLFLRKELDEKRQEERAVWIYKENGNHQRNPVKRESIYCINAFKNMTQIFSSGKMLHTISQGKMLHTISQEKMFQENLEKTELQYKEFVEMVKPVSRDSLTEHWFPRETRLGENSLNLFLRKELDEKRQGERAVWIYKENGTPQRNPVKRESMFSINAFKNLTRILFNGKMLHTIFREKMHHTTSGEKMFQENSEKTILFTAQEPLIATIRGDMQILLHKNRPSLLNHVLTECAVNAHSCPVKSNEKTELQYKKFEEIIKPNFREKMLHTISGEKVFQETTVGNMFQNYQDFPSIFYGEDRVTESREILEGHKENVYEEKNELFDYLREINHNNREMQKRFMQIHTESPGENSFVIDKKTSMEQMVSALKNPGQVLFEIENVSEEKLYQNKADIRIQNMLSLTDENTRTLLKEVMEYPQKGGGDKFSIIETDQGGFNRFLNKVTEVFDVLTREEKSPGDSFELVHKTQDVREEVITEMVQEIVNSGSKSASLKEADVIEKVRKERERTDRENHKLLLTNVEEMIRNKMEIVSGQVYRDLERKFKSDQSRRGY